MKSKVLANSSKFVTYLREFAKPLSGATIQTLLDVSFAHNPELEERVPVPPTGGVW